MSFISAVESTQQYSKIFLNPFYRTSMSSNTNYYYSLWISVPDDIQEVYSAIISFDVYLTPTVNYDLWINGVTCNNPRFSVSTTYSGSSQGRLYFDCSNVLYKEGFYNITLKSDKNSGASVGWLDLTYSNNPKGNLKLFGTEYSYGQDGKIWLQLLFNNNTEIDNAICYANIFYPSGDYFLEDITMNNLGHDGIYYYDFEIPIIQGVYLAVAKCYYEAGQLLSFASNYFIELGTYDSGTIADTYSIDGNFIRFRETTTNPVRNISVGFNFTDGKICSNISEALLTGITIRTYGRFDSVVNDDITISIWNHTSSSWFELPNKILEGASWKDVTNSFSLNNISNTGFVNSSGTGFRLRFKDTTLTDGATSNLDIDYAVVSCDKLSNPQWEEVRGSSELHVSSDFLYEFFIDYGELTNSTFYNYFNLYYTIASGVSESKDDVLIKLDTWRFAFPCPHLLNVQLLNETNSVWDNLTFYSYQGEDLTCGVKFLLNLSEGENYGIRIVSDNFWKREFLSTYQDLQLQKEIIDIGCINYQQYMSLPNYTLPLNSAIPSNDTLYRECYSYKDWVYKWENEAFPFLYLLSISQNFTEFEMDSLEGQYYHIIDTSEKILRTGDNIYNAWLLGNAYSQAVLSDPYPPTNPTYATYFSSISSSYINYQAILNISNQVWNYENKTLDSFNFSVNVNSSEIADMVWNYQGSRNLTFTEDKTNYTFFSSLFNNILNSITDIPANVWNFTARTLTSFDFDNTNYSKVAEYVWLYEGNRSLTFYQVNDISPEEIWNYTSRTLTFTEDKTNYTLIQEMINAIPDKTNYTQIENLLNQLDLSDKTNYTLIFELIENQTQFDMTNYSKVAEYTWLYVDRNLTTYPIGNNITAEDIWSYYNRSLTQDIPLQIWSYPNRNLTTDIPFEIWSYENRTLTYYTLNLTEILYMLNELDYSEIEIPFLISSPTGIISNELNVSLYIS
jgi:hypothetical protein